MTAQLGISIHASGPLFGRYSSGSFLQGGTIATPAIFRLDGAQEAFDWVIQRSVEELVRLGMIRLFQQGQAKPGGVFLSVEEARAHGSIPSTGYWRAHLNVSTTHFRGTITNSAVYTAWLEGVGSANDRLRFRGYGMFRKTETYLEEEAQRVVERFTNEAVRRLNG